jgi:hypothetical protein
MSMNAGPMGSANREIRDAIDGFVAERLASRRLPTLLERTDTMLAELETLNLMEVRSTPASLRSALTALVADLPFEYAPRIGPRVSPTAAIDVVFEIQAGIFHLMYGTEPVTPPATEPATEPIEMAS